jgi:crotonobetainyl-CoA:carnitine CoA-transferase CaiB-like acyl-CoA transferase
MSRPRDELVRWMIENNVPILPVYTPDETVQSDHVAARGLVEWLSDPHEGRIPVLANPLAHSGLTREHRRPAPLLGGHQDILNQTGAFTWTTQSPQRQEIP